MRIDCPKCSVFALKCGKMVRSMEIVNEGWIRIFHSKIHLSETGVLAGLPFRSCIAMKLLPPNYRSCALAMLAGTG